MPRATCPEPLGATEDGTGLRMARVDGVELLDELAADRVDVQAAAVTIAAALIAYVEAVGESYRDLKLGNLLRAGDGTLIFLDVGEPQDAGPAAPGDSPYEISMGNLVASLIFESARPKRLARRAQHRNSAALAVALAGELRARGAALRADRLAGAARRDFVRSTFGRRSPVRTAWYATVGYVAGTRVALPDAPVGPVPVWAAGRVTRDAGTSP